MFQWIILYCVYLFVQFTACASANEPETCNCTLISSNGNTTQGVQFLRCQRGEWNRENPHQVPCQRVGALIRVGPISNLTRVNGPQGGETVIPRSDIQIAPWAFTDLVRTETSAHRLQLDLDLPRYETTALSLAGLDALRELLTRTSLLQWDQCSFAALPRLEELLINCKSTFRDFLTFGPAIRLVRFVDCEDVSLQFYCNRCVQDPKVHVIRIRPGPPLRQYMIKFSKFSSEQNSSERAGQISIGQCVPNICSDRMLCRDNEPLKLVMSNWGKPTEPVTQTTISTVITSPAVSKDATNSSESYSITNVDQTEVTEQNDVTTTQTVVSVLTQKRMSWPHNIRVWIVAAAILIGIALVITIFVLIALVRQRSNKNKFTPSIRLRRPGPGIANGDIVETTGQMVNQTKLLEPTELNATGSV